MRLRFARAVLVASLLWPVVADPAAAAPAGPPRRVMLVLDASGSMWGQIGGEAKIVLARRALAGLVAGLPAGSEVGLVAYGHRRDGDCQDIETLLPLGPLAPGALDAKLAGLQPKGKTPIAGALQEALRLVKASGKPATVILISDGLDTCGTDPCAVVRQAAAAQADVLVHVVGFGIEEGDLSSLECIAQAGHGLFFDARDGKALAAALEGAVAPVPGAAGGELRVGAMADGKPVDATVLVFPQGAKKEAASGRTYAAATTNPRTFLVPPGRYDVAVSAVRIAGASRRFEGVEVKEGQPVTLTADFSTGELRVGVKRNGKLSDATVEIFAEGGKQRVDGGRTYRQPASNPKRFRLPAGLYEVVVSSVEIAGKPERRQPVTVEPGKPAEVAVVFETGDLLVGAKHGGQLVDATVAVTPEGGKEIDRCRTYDKPTSNPCRFTLPPGRYRIDVKAVKLPGSPQKQPNATVTAGGEVTVTGEF